MNTLPRTLALSADRLGIWASALCVVHCIVTPVLLSMSVVFSRLIPGEERTHRTLAVGIAALGAIALINGYRRHGRRRVFAMMGAGLVFIFVGAFYGSRMPAHIDEVLVTMTGSVLMIAAHRMNHTFCKSCGICTGEEQ
jgi:hypothetical protein